MSDQTEGWVVLAIAGFVLTYGWLTGDVAIRNLSLSRQDDPGLYWVVMTLAGALLVIAVLLLAGVL